jgi:hypothetical protein
LIHTNVLRVCGVFFISNLFIMTLAFIGLAQIITKGKPPALPGDS